MPIEIRELVIKASVNKQRTADIEIQVRQASNPERSGLDGTVVRSTQELISLLRRFGIGGDFSGRFMIDSDRPNDTVAQQVAINLKRAGYGRAEYAFGPARQASAFAHPGNLRPGLATVELPIP